MYLNGQLMFHVRNGTVRVGEPKKIPDCATGHSALADFLNMQLKGWSIGKEQQMLAVALGDDIRQLLDSNKICVSTEQKTK